MRDARLTDGLAQPGLLDLQGTQQEGHSSAKLPACEVQTGQVVQDRGDNGMSIPSAFSWMARACL